MPIEGARVRGVEELMRFFDKFPEKLQKKVLQSATRSGAREVAKEYRRRLPKRKDPPGLKWLGASRRFKVHPGFLRAEVTVWKRRKGVSKHETVYAAGVHTTRKQKPWPFYAVILERGAKPHGGHPGIPAGNFLRRALEAVDRKVLETMRRKTEQGIERQLSKRG